MGIWDYTPWGKNSAPSNTTSTSSCSGKASDTKPQPIEKKTNSYLVIAHNKKLPSTNVDAFEKAGQSSQKPSKKNKAKENNTDVLDGVIKGLGATVIAGGIAWLKKRCDLCLEDSVNSKADQTSQFSIIESSDNSFNKSYNKPKRAEQIDTDCKKNQEIRKMYRQIFNKFPSDLTCKEERALHRESKIATNAIKDCLAKSQEKLAPGLKCSSVYQHAKSEAPFNDDIVKYSLDCLGKFIY